LGKTAYQKTMSAIRPPAGWKIENPGKSKTSEVKHE